MVFHRFLAGEAGGRKVRITVNGNPVKPWDPFAREERGTKPLQPVSLAYDYDGVSGAILIEPFVLPHQEEFSSPQAHAAAAGPLKWNRQQGFYIYRANRMIQSGGWSNLRTMDEHIKLARVAVSFKPRLDEVFKINVAKMRVQIPQQLRDEFEKAIRPVISIAQTAYRRPKGARHPAGGIDGHPANSAPTGRRTQISVTASVGRRSGIGGVWTIDEIRCAAERVATPVEKPIVRTVFDRLVEKLGRD